MLPHRAWETGMKIGFFKSFTRCCFLETANCGSFRKRTAMKLKLWWSLGGGSGKGGWQQRQRQVYGMKAHSLGKPGAVTWSSSVPLNPTGHQLFTQVCNQPPWTLLLGSPTYRVTLCKLLNPSGASIGIKWDHACKALLTVTGSEPVVNKRSCD